ncbi:DNA replication and checkpoint protein-domain-containing protein [Paraphoma chrysanthemicola]|nr:DNA replication and checkpoint protein-domain-containing protein [Paraphoma chrysanthemicola]
MSVTEIEQRCNALRNDLKLWEKTFAAQNGGRKAGRDDIKANEDISNKYKEYNKLRGKLSAPAAPQTPSKRSTSRRTARDVERTPKGPPKALISTPLKRKREEELAAEAIPQSPEFLSPQGPSFIGPTPQRDGIVLGLFDLLPAGTPSKRRAVLANVELNVVQTPSRRGQEAASETSLESRARGDRTPQSAGKRFMLNQFVTPKKRRLDDEGTPSSTARGLATPAFLRRGNILGAIDETDETTPRPAPWKRRGLGRSLSAMIQAMRKDEDDKLDEEADIMREMEMEEAGIVMPKKAPVPEIHVEDSQTAMPLGPDRGLESDEDEDEQPELGPDGQPRRAWKKKGLKRQTRRVIMRPNFTKSKPEPSLQVHDESEDDEVVAETQATGDAADDIDSDDESDYASDASHTPRRRAKPKNKEDEEKDKSEEGTVKKAARKIKATANANFRRLKIKSSTGAKGKPKFGGKFGRYEVPWRAERTFVPSHAPPRSYRTPSQLPLAATTTTTAPSTPTTLPLSPPLTTVPDNPDPPHIMAEKELASVLQQLHKSLQSHDYQQSTSLLSKAKIALLNINALIPQEKSSRKHLQLARETLELGAIISIRLKDTVSFTRYFQQLQPFYSLPEKTLPKDGGNASKVTGLYLLLLLSEGDYAGFHTLLETLEVAAAQDGKKLEDDQFVQYPIRLEQALMEGSYDRVWGQTKKDNVPSEEFGLFTEILIGTIRKEIASCSERAYPSIPVSDAKSLLFLDSEGSVVQFAKESGWVVKDSRIYFPQQEDDYLSKDILVTSDQVIENTLGYARELETIV